MGLEATAAETAPTMPPPLAPVPDIAPGVNEPNPVAPPKRAVGRPPKPLDEKTRKEKAEREVARRMMKKLEGAKSKQEFWDRINKLKTETTEHAETMREVFGPTEKTPADIRAEQIAQAERQVQETQAVLGQFVAMAQSAAEGTPFALTDQKAKVLIFTATPWAASQEKLDLSPRMKGVLALTGLGAWLLPPLLGMVKEHGPKVAAWMRERRERQAART